MDTFTPFAAGSTRPDPAAIPERLAEQSIALEEVLSDLIAAGYDRVAGQEKQLASVARTLSSEASRRVAQQGELLGQVVDTLTRPIDAKLAEQRAALAAIPVDPREFTPGQPGIPTWAEPFLPTNTDALAPGVMLAGPADYSGCSEQPGPPVSAQIVNGVQTGWFSLGGKAFATLEEFQEWALYVYFSNIPPPKYIRLVPVETQVPGYNSVIYYNCPTTPPPPVVPPTPPPVVPSPVPPPPAGRIDNRPDLSGCFKLVPCDVTAAPAPYPPRPPEPPVPPPPPPPPPVSPGPGPPPAPAPTPHELPEWNLSTERFCVYVEDYVKEFSALGRLLEDMLIAVVTEVGAVAEVLNAISQLPFIKSVAGVIPRVPEAYKQLMGYLKDEFIDVATVYLGKRRHDLVGLYFAKCIFRIADITPIGVNFILQGGVQVQVEINQLRQIVEYLIDYLYPVRVPDQGSLDTLYMGGEITRAHWDCLTRTNGYQPELEERIVHARRAQPTADDLIRYYTRLQHRKRELPDRLRRAGWMDSADQDVIGTNSVYLPPPSDIIRFAVKDVFDPAKLGRREMIAELKQQVGLQELFDAQGLSDTVVTTADGRTLPVPTSLLYWLASYDEISPTQGFEMLHRLRPNRLARYRLPGPGGSTVLPQAMDMDTLRKLLKEKDYNPIWRDRLAAISYRVIPRSDLFKIYLLGGFGEPKGTKGIQLAPDGTPGSMGTAEKELYEGFLDFGYASVDAARQTFTTARDWELRRLTPFTRRTISRVCQSYTAGTIGEPEALKLLRDVLPFPEDAERHLAACDAQVSNLQVRESIGAIKRIFVRGVGTEAEVRGMLVAAGITARRIDQYIARWKLVKLGGRKQIMAAQLRGWFDEGIIGRAEFKDRLINIGFAPEDADRIIRHAELKELARTTKERDRLAAAQRREQERLARQNQSDADRAARAGQNALARFLATRPKSDMRNWLNQRTISERDVRDTLALTGMQPADIDRWIIDARVRASGGN